MQKPLVQPLERFFQTIVPSQWTGTAHDEQGTEIFYTASQFLDAMPQLERSPLNWDYEVKWDGKSTVKISRYPHLQHEAAYSTFINTGNLDAQTFIDHYDLSPIIEEYAKRQALIVESVVMDTETDYRTLFHYCTNYILPYYWQQRSGTPTNWNTDQCIEFYQKFTPAWIDAYMAASVRRMRALATEPKKQFITF